MAGHDKHANGDANGHMNGSINGYANGYLPSAAAHTKASLSSASGFGHPSTSTSTFDPHTSSASASTSFAIAPRSWLRKYEAFISDNASSVSQIESALRSLTYIIPGRFRESELASESLHSFISLLSTYHTSLLHRVYSTLPPSIPRPKPTLHNRYTTFWTSHSSTYRRIAQLLQTLQYTELLWEMLARRRGQKTRWRVVVLLEAIKAFCRLLLLRLTNARMLVNPPLPERDVDPRVALEAEARAREGGSGGWDGMDDPPPSENEKEGDSDKGLPGMSWTMPRTGLTLPSLPDTTDVTGYLLSKVLTSDDIKAPRQLLRRLRGSRAQVAEIMWILRPVVYALLLQRFQESKGKGRGMTGGRVNVWLPWLVGFGLELGARQLAKRDFSERLAGGLRGLTGLEKEEMKSRGWGMAWWGLRGAFYENVTRHWIQGVSNKLKGKMLLDMVAVIIEDYDYLWDEYYFSTATM